MKSNLFYLINVQARVILCVKIRKHEWRFLARFLLFAEGCPVFSPIGKRRSARPFSEVSLDCDILLDCGGLCRGGVSLRLFQPIGLSLSERQDGQALVTRPDGALRGAGARR